MIGAFESDEGMAPRVVPGQFDGAFHGVRSCRASIKDAAEFIRQDCFEEAGHRFAGGSGDVERVGEIVDLVTAGLEDIRMAVADIEDAGPSEKIDINISVDVLHGSSLASPKSHRQPPGIGYSRPFVKALKFQKLF
jgi:hypothetical protein